MKTILKKANELKAFEELTVNTSSEKRFDAISEMLYKFGWTIWISAFPYKTLVRKDGAIVNINYTGEINE